MKNKKIGIISVHYGVNFGSALQAYSLCKYITDNYSKCDVQIINYIPSRFTFNKMYKNRKSKNIISTLKWLIRYIFLKIMNYKYYCFLKKNVNISSKIRTFESAKRRYSNFNILITGSDQVWNSDYNGGIDSMYYLDFAQKNTKKVAYAASCGKNDYTDSEWISIKKYLSSFDIIGLREKQDVELFQKHNILNCDYVLDPTFLFDSNEWSRIEKKYKKIHGEYVLIYLLDVDGKEIIEKAKKYATEHNLKTVMICTGLCKNRYNVDYIFYKLTPEYYIFLFRNATYVFTNSFHGTSFSINMEKQFVVFKRDKYNKRIDNILELMKLENRFIKIEDDINKLDKINYSKVKAEKMKMKDKSKKVIEKIVE